MERGSAHRGRQTNDEGALGCGCYGWRRGAAPDPGEESVELGLPVCLHRAVGLDRATAEPSGGIEWDYANLRVRMIHRER